MATDGMKPPDPGAAARAEFRARREAAERDAGASEARAMTVVRRDLGLLAPAGDWANVGWWSLRLGELAEAQAAFDRSLGWYVRWIDLLATAGPPARLRGADWMIVLERAVIAGNEAATASVLATPVDLGDRSLTPTLRAWATGIAALLRSDDPGAIAEAERIRAVPDKTLVRERSYPRLGDAILHLVAGGAPELRSELDAICEHHVGTVRRGFRRRSETGLVCVPATVLAILARRRGVAADVDERYHRTAIEIWRHGDPDRYVSENGLFSAEYDLVPWRLGIR